MTPLREKASGTRLWLRIVLFASLALNLAVVGLVAGALLKGPPRPDARLEGGDPVMPYTRAFDDDQRKALRRELWRNLREDRRAGDRPDVLAEYREAIAVIRAEPFDLQALNVLLDAQGTRSDQRRRRGQEVLSRYLANLDPAERQAYADRLEEQLQRFDKRRRARERD